MYELTSILKFWQIVIIQFIYYTEKHFKQNELINKILKMSKIIESKIGPPKWFNQNEFSTAIQPVLQMPIKKLGFYSKVSGKETRNESVCF